MSEQLKNVLEHPRSLKARHVLANYLISIDDPLGQLIKNRLRLHERDETASLARLSAHYHSLLAKHEDAWTVGIREFTPYFELDLGMVVHAAMSGEAFVTRGEDLLATAPIISFYIESPYDLQRVLDSNVLRHAVNLELEAGVAVDDTMAIAIAESRSVRQLRLLRLTGGSITQRGLSALATSKNLPDLISIEVTGNPSANSGGVMRNDDRDYYICPAGESFLNAAQHDMLLSSDPTTLQWPPLFDEFAWLP